MSSELSPSLPRQATLEACAGHDPDAGTHATGSQKMLVYMLIGGALGWAVIAWVLL
ncbi:hypothetical protein [Paracoccus liaowanqingii]|uniref:hypothetical protein n=1 Tax=Paracoccus liaowanqingii TaxID=2560053 RepID=UPI00159BABF7|nr:hypothetical protein [Paracoccus liaowanqingii]